MLQCLCSENLTLGSQLHELYKTSVNDELGGAFYPNLVSNLLIIYVALQKALPEFLGARVVSFNDCKWTE